MYYSIISATLLYRYQAIEKLRPPYKHNRRLCFTIFKQFYYSTIAPCELYTVSLNVLLMANVWRLLKVLGYLVIVLGPRKKKKTSFLNFHEKDTFPIHEWIRECALIFKSICTSIMDIKSQGWCSLNDKYTTKWMHARLYTEILYVYKKYDLM